MTNLQSSAAATTKRQHRARLPVEHIEIEAAILCEAARAGDGVINLIAGGWEHRYTDFKQPPHPEAITTGIILLVPWGSCNTPHTFSAAVLDADGRDCGSPVSIPLTLGRPAEVPPGTPQRMAINLTMGAVFRQPGNYAVVLSVDDTSYRRLPFRVVAAP